MIELNRYSVSTVLQKPLMIGASVSADGKLSPGKKVALHYTALNSIMTEALAGRTGYETVRRILPRTVRGRTIIIAIDLFFWDSVLVDLTHPLLALDRIMQLVWDERIPIVIGNVPELLPGRQPLRKRINLAIEQKCMQYSRCAVMDLDGIHQKILSDGFLEVDHQNYSIKDLLPDGLHPNEIASNYLTDLLLETILKIGH